MAKLQRLATKEDGIVVVHNPVSEGEVEQLRVNLHDTMQKPIYWIGDFIEDTIQRTCVNQHTFH
ncbi:hypothetical protein M3650_07655 [Paenibacillus sp. MER TA 81-3]|uniref:hypothetical protein n=1 Tax=Paenibacillus sp. MER TA 81-3 TaxID=2939573 RepID=UPI00203AF766|nr:hypothetical protein [Paenibacillus sp. MER TA 81-3]MCM3338509.1 hypothetical protein [Paenibacillus sp. MER TA 81-3]